MARLFQGQHDLLRQAAENGMTLIFTLPSSTPPGPGKESPPAAEPFGHEPHAGPTGGLKTPGQAAVDNLCDNP